MRLRKVLFGIGASATLVTVSAASTEALLPNPMASGTTYGQVVDLCGLGYQWGNYLTAGYSKILNYGSGSTNCRVLAVETRTTGGHTYDAGGYPAANNTWYSAGSSIAYDAFSEGDISVSGLNGAGGRCDWVATINSSGAYTGTFPHQFSYSPGPACSVS